MKTYHVRLKLRGTVGQRKTAVRRVQVWADSPEDALAKAKEELIERVSFEVEARS